MLPEGFSWQDAGDTDVGDPGEHEYLAIYTPSDGTEYETVRDVPVKVRVFRDVDASMFSVDAAGLAYDGSAHEPAVSSAVVPEGSYSVGYRDNVSAGEATAVVSGEGFYRGSCELKFAIAKATPDYEAPAPVEAAYGQTLSDAALPGASRGRTALRPQLASLASMNSWRCSPPTTRPTTRLSATSP